MLKQMYKIIILLLASLQLINCTSFYIAASGPSQTFNCPQPGFNNCMTLQQYVDNTTVFQRETENITLELETGFHVMTSTLNLLGNARNSFTMRAINPGDKANILCIGDSDINNAGGIGISIFDRVTIQDLNFIQCSRNRIGTTSEAIVQNVQFQSNFLFSYMLLITRVENAALSQTQFLPSRCRLCSASTPLLSAAESSVTIENVAFSSNGEQSFRITGIIANDANITIADSVFNNFSSRAIETRNGQNRRLSITNSTFLNNRLSSIFRSSGGAIRSTSLILTIDNCQFQNSFARESGGALHLTGFNSSISISQSLFRDNSVSIGSGGAVLISRQLPSGPFERDIISTPFSILISESEFVNNTNQRAGGAVSISNSGASTIIIEKSKFFSNFVIPRSGTIAGPSGGAVTISGDDATALIEQCVFMDNAVSRFNGGALSMSPSARLLTLRSSLFQNNSAGLNGGAVALAGVFNPGFSETRIDNCTFTNNVAGGSCGAIETRLANVMSSTFSFNMAMDGGGAGCFRGGSVSNSTFLNNTAERRSGGAITLPFRISVIQDSVFSGNSAGRDGGAVSGSGNRVFRSIFAHNRAAEDGGAITGPDIVEDSKFESNTAGANGGAISGSPLSVNTSYFADNEAENDGGAINVDCTARNSCAFRDTIPIQSSMFVRNRARDGIGGVLSIVATGSIAVTLTNSVFDSNSAISCGVVNLLPLLSSQSTGDIIHTLNVLNSSFTNNAVSREQFIMGGGALCLRNAAISIVESSFVANMAEFVGGVLSIGGSELNVKNSTFMSNTARDRGGVLYVQSNWPPVYVNISNSVFMSNRARNRGGVFFIASNGSELAVTESTIQQNRVDNFGSRGGVFDIDGVCLKLTDSIVSENEANLPGNTISACDSNITIVNSSDEDYFFEITRNENTPFLRPDAMCFVYDLVPVSPPIVTTPPPILTTPTVVPSDTPTETTTTIASPTEIKTTSSVIIIDTESVLLTLESQTTAIFITPSQTITPSAVQGPISTTTVPIIITNAPTAPPPITTDASMGTTNSGHNQKPLILGLGLIVCLISALLC